MRFLDLGCGSGILSIAAARLWPARAGWPSTSIPRRWRPPTRTSSSTGSRRVETRLGSLGAVDGPHELVLANIQAGVLTALAADFPSRVAPGGTVILSGMLAEQADAVLARVHGRRASRSRRGATRTSGPRCGSAGHERSAGCSSPPSGSPARQVTLTGPEHRHVARVLRARPGDTLTLFDGAGGEVEARVVRVARTETELALGARRAVAGPAVPLTLLVAVPRGPRMDFLVQKTTELGVARIVPVVTERSVARPDAEAGRRARWEKIAREAARQCGRADVPRSTMPVSLAAALAAPDLPARRLALFEGEAARSLRAALAGAEPAADGAAGRTRGGIRPGRAGGGARGGVRSGRPRRPDPARRDRGHRGRRAGGGRLRHARLIRSWSAGRGR